MGGQQGDEFVNRVVGVTDGENLSCRRGHLKFHAKIG
jgi:hypothetical protein